MLFLFYFIITRLEQTIVMWCLHMVAILYKYLFFCRLVCVYVFECSLFRDTFSAFPFFSLYFTNSIYHTKRSPLLSHLCLWCPVLLTISILIRLQIIRYWWGVYTLTRMLLALLECCILKGHLDLNVPWKGQFKSLKPTTISQFIG